MIKILKIKTRVIHKGVTAALLAAALIPAFCGCQATPENGVVASKNDGAFEAALEGAPEAAEEQGSRSEAAVYTDSFENAAGDISVELALTGPTASGPMRVLKIRPMEFTGEQSEKIARALFGDVPIYEYTEEMTKAEIEQAILDDRKFIGDWDAMLDYYGGNEETARSVKEDFEGRIAAMEEAYQTAPDNVEPTLCAWEFHPEEYYLSPRWGYMWEDEGFREIKATASVDGIPYQFNVTNLETAERHYHTISCYIDERIFSREEMPGAGSEQDIEALTAWSLEAVEKMDLGQWAAVSDDTALASGAGGITDEYCRVVLTRVYDGAQAAMCAEWSDKSEQYAPNYGPEYMIFEFVGGHLYSFWYYCAMQTVGTVNEDVRTQPFADIVDRAKEQMKMVTQDRIMYGGADVRITADRAELGLVCIRIKDNAAEYYMVPAYIFYGTAVSYDENGRPETMQYLNAAGEVVGEEPAQSVVQLAVINAVDGTAVNTTMGY